MGLEPTRHCCHKILSLARLPVPTLPRIGQAFLDARMIIAKRSINVNNKFKKISPFIFALFFGGKKY